MASAPQIAEPIFQQPSRTTQLLREFVQKSLDFQRRIEDITEVNSTDRLVMERLVERGPQSPSELALAIGITPAAMTTSLDRLEALGHARRSPHHADRRRIVVTATDESRRIIMAEIMSMVRDIETVADDFSPEELETVTRFLDRVVNVYARHVD